MKKTYISPIVMVVKVATHGMLATSLQNGEQWTEGEAGAREAEFDDDEY